MSGPGPRFPIRAPIPSPPLLSLWSMRTPFEPDEQRDASGVRRWGNGINFTPAGCGADVVTMDMGCAEGGAYQADTKPTKVLVENQEFDPISIVGPETCTGFSRRDVNEYRSTAFQKLEACWVKQLEYELWTGTTYPTNPNLSDALDITPGGTAMDICDAVAQAEEYLTDCSCGGLGMIHMTVRTFTLAVSENLIIIPGDNPRGGVAMTKRGTLVVPGVGYTGSSPTNSFSATSEYIYATGPVKVDRSEPVLVPDDLEGAVNRQTNQITFYAELAAIFAFDPCCNGAIKTTVVGGGGS